MDIYIYIYTVYIYVYIKYIYIYIYIYICIYVYIILIYRTTYIFCLYRAVAAGHFGLSSSGGLGALPLGALRLGALPLEAFFFFFGFHFQICKEMFPPVWTG